MTMTMTKTNLEHFRKLFLEMKSNSSIDELETKLTQKVRGDDADMALMERDRALLIKLKRRQGLYIRKVNEALLRVDNGSFGECEECDSEIEHNRLLARPTATCCISCKEEQERGEGHLLYAKRSHTLGKELNNDGLNTFSMEGEEIANIKALNLKRRGEDLGLQELVG